MNNTLASVMSNAWYNYPKSLTICPQASATWILRHTYAVFVVKDSSKPSLKALIICTHPNEHGH